jgi:cephalosporin-C deacetylase-like acetyl esterase
VKEVVFESNGLTIHGSLALPHQADYCPGVVVFHGMTASEEGYLPFITQLADNGIAGLAVTMRGHGLSEGDFTTTTVREALADGLAAYDFLLRQP